MRLQRRIIGLVAMGAAAGIMLACGAPSTVVESAEMGKGAVVSFAIHSPAWKPGQEIPRQFTCDGENISPPLSWDAPPAGTESFSLVLEDPDAPGGTFTHWVLYDLPASARDLAASVPEQDDLPSGARQGRNSFGKIGYGGPCPPPGRAHRYYFRLFALDRKTGAGPRASRADLERAIRGHVLAQAEFMGRYKRR